MEKVLSVSGNLVSVSSVTALVFQIEGRKATKKLWDMTKEDLIRDINEHGGFPAVHEMPCGSRLEFDGANAIRVLEVKDISCPCGDSTHWLVRFVNKVRRG